jgi:hypothetical protein
MRKGLLLTAAWTLFGIAAVALFLGYWPILSGDFASSARDGLAARSEVQDQLLLTVLHTLLAATTITIGMLLRKSARKYPP